METPDSGNLTEEQAVGARGCLIRTIDDRVMFRVYNHNRDFVDYEITHHDCEIVIIDPSAALIRCDAGDFLDYSLESMRIAKN